jgi:uncharacterized protein (DUF58 family)
MWTSFQNSFFFNKIKTLGKSEQLYIIPTLDGIKLASLNLILIIIGLVYANNYILLFNFILFCLFLGSMFYTHFNLVGLKLISAKLSPIHVNDCGILTLQFKSTSELGHYFLGIRLNHQLIEVQDKSFTFSLESNAQKTFKINIPIKGVSRGDIVLNKLCVETLFPFHLFRSFVYFNPHLTIAVYPEKKDLNIHQSDTFPEDKQDDGDDFTLNDFKAGDPLKRVHWKKLAQTNRWYSKNLISPNITPIMLSLKKDHLLNIDLENQLSSLCFAIHLYHFQNIKYGLTLGENIIAPNHSNHHLNHCLHALADYEN